MTTRRDTVKVSFSPGRFLVEDTSGNRIWVDMSNLGNLRVTDSKQPLAWGDDGRVYETDSHRVTSADEYWLPPDTVDANGAPIDTSKPWTGDAP